jgi:hypothetical protein
MLFAGFLVLVGSLILVGWLMGGRKNVMLRNLGLVTLGIGFLLSIIGLILYFTTT